MNQLSLCENHIRECIYMKELDALHISVKLNVS